MQVSLVFFGFRKCIELKTGLVFVHFKYRVMCAILKVFQFFFNTFVLSLSFLMYNFIIALETSGSVSPGVFFEADLGMIDYHLMVLTFLPSIMG